MTNFFLRRVGSRSPYRMAKSHWEIETQGFNDAKNRHGMEHICHHESNSLLLQWLITVLALTIERLCRLRHLHRGTHPVRTAIELVRLLWLSLGRPLTPDTSQPPPGGCLFLNRSSQPGLLQQESYPLKMPARTRGSPVSPTRPLSAPPGATLAQTCEAAALASVM